MPPPDILQNISKALPTNLYSWVNLVTYETVSKRVGFYLVMKHSLNSTKFLFKKERLLPKSLPFSTREYDFLERNDYLFLYK